jgi:polar amino acid transport system substrate-binding protein
MKLDKLTVAILSVLLAIPQSVRGEPVLENIQNTGLIRVGIREDSVPFGYRNLDNDLAGLCLDFVALLRRRIQDYSSQDIFTVKIFQSTLFNRFDLVEDRVVDLECGPNTINREGHPAVDFSSPFLVTGVQFLIRRQDRSKFNFNGSLEDLAIGVLRDTTTEKFIEDRYPLARIQRFQGRTGRVRGIQALQRGRIDAFVSDGILLVGEATLLGLALDTDYLIVPERPLTCEYYGLILPKQDPQWQNLVDGTIDLALSGLVIADWFNVVDHYIQETRRYCKDIVTK